MYKVVLIYPSGQKVEDDEVFETKEEATEYGLEQCGNYAVGREVLHMSNAGDYPLGEDVDDFDFDVIEVDG